MEELKKNLLTKEDTELEEKEEEEKDDDECLVESLAKETENLKSKVKYLEDVVKSIKLDHEEKNVDLDGRVSETEIVLIKELFQGFNTAENSFVCLVGWCSNCCSCCWIFIIALVVFVFFLKNFIAYFSDSSMVSSTTLIDIKSENDPKVTTFPMIFFCTYELPTLNFYQNFSFYALEENNKDITSEIPYTFFSLPVADGSFPVVHNCLVINPYLKDYQVKRAESGALFPYEIIAGVEKTNDHNFSSFSWFMPIHQELLREYEFEDRSIPEIYLRTMFGAYTDDELGKKLDEDTNFTPNFLPQGTSLMRYQIEKTYHENRYQLLDLMLIGLLFEFKILKDIQYVSDVNEPLSDVVEKCSSGKCSFINIVDIKFNMKQYLETVVRRTQSDFTSPFVATGGIIVTLRIIPALLISCWKCCMRTLYGTASGCYRSRIRKKKKKKFKKLAGEMNILGMIIPEEEEEEIEEEDVEMKDLQNDEEEEEKKKNNDKEKDESESEESSDNEKEKEKQVSSEDENIEEEEKNDKSSDDDFNDF